MKLIELTDAVHPGGWADIVQFMLDKDLKFSIDLRHPLYITHGILKADELDGHIAGLLAVEAYRVLRKAGWYNPGDPQWAQACSEWVKEYAEPQPIKRRARK